MERYEKYAAKLMRALLDDDLEKIAIVVSEELGCPFNITDETYRMLVQVPNQKINDLIWDTYIENRTLPAHIIKKLNEIKLIEIGYQSKRAYKISKGEIGGCPRVCSKLSKSGKIYGYITAYFEDREVREDDIEKLAIANEIITFYLSKSLSIRASVCFVFLCFFFMLFSV